MVLNWKKYWKPLQKKDYSWIIFWTFGGSLNMVFFFIAANKIQIGTLYFIAYAFIILTGFLLGNLFFKEKLNLIKFISSILAIVGLCLVYTVSFEPKNAVYLVFAAIVGITASFWSTLSKKISHHYSNIQMTLMDAFVSSGVTFFIAMMMSEPIPALKLSIPWFGMILNVITQILGVGAVVYGYKHIEVQLASIITPVEVVFAALFGYVIFHEVLSPFALLGGSCIFVAALLPHLIMNYKKQE